MFTHTHSQKQINKDKANKIKAKSSIATELCRTFFMINQAYSKRSAIKYSEILTREVDDNENNNNNNQIQRSI